MASEISEISTPTVLAPALGQIIEKKEPIHPLRLLGITSWVVVASMNIILPKEVSYASKKAALMLGTIMAFGTVFQLLGLFSSFFSDRCTSKLGRRRPFILTSGILAAFGCSILLIGIKTNQIIIGIIGYYLAMSSVSIGLPALQALMPQILPREQIGLSSGFVGLWVAAGGILGFGVFSLGCTVSTALYCDIGASVLATCLSVFCIKETPITKEQVSKTSIASQLKDFVFNPKKHFDFLLLLFLRGFTSFGLGCVGFMQYFIRDMLGSQNPQKDSARLQFVMFAFTLIAPLVGFLVDKSKKPKLLLICGFVLNSIGISFYLWNKSFSLMFISMGLTGISLMVKQVCDFSLVVQVMPKAGGAAKFMSESTLCYLIGQTAGSQILGIILQQFEIKQRISDSFSSSYSSSSLVPITSSYDSKGYFILYSISIAIELICCVVALCINTERGRKVQEPETKSTEETPLVINS